MNQLIAVNQEILKHKCDLPICNMAKNIVVGDGPDNADVVIIGEAPGQHEDESGHPFVGAAGEILNQVLKAAGLKRKKVFITNIVKARPPHNRGPQRNEIVHYKPWLIAQILAIRPKVIVPLGAHALSHFDDRKISLVHGEPIQRPASVLFPLYHPAAALHNPDLRTTLIDDAKRLGRTLEVLS